MLFVGAEIRLLYGKGLIKKGCLQSMFKSDDSVAITDIEWYRIPGGGCRMSKGTRCDRTVASRSREEKQSGENRLVGSLVDMKVVKIV